MVYVWAHNGAAVVGITICLLLLFAWFHQRFPPLDVDDAENKPPREEKEPNETE